MPATPRHCCPVCRRHVKPTMGGLIYGHWDSIGRAPCRASWYPYDITIMGARMPVAGQPKETQPCHTV